MSNEFLKVSGLTKKFGSFTAVNDVSFSLPKGEAFACSVKAAVVKQPCCEASPDLRIHARGRFSSVTKPSSTTSQSSRQIREMSVWFFRTMPFSRIKMSVITSPLALVNTPKRHKSSIKCSNSSALRTNVIKCLLNFPAVSSSESRRLVL